MKVVKRLVEQFKPDQYDLAIALNLDSNTFTGTVSITGTKTGRPSKRITFHQHDLKIIDAQILRHDKKGPQPIPVSRINLHKGLDEVRLHADSILYPGHYVVTIHFKGEIQNNMHGIYRSTYKIDGKNLSVISTQFESHHAREAFPCIDEPEAKAVFNLTLTSPADEAVLSNMPVKSQSTKNKSLTTIFEASPIMSSYLLAFVCGDLQYKEAKTTGNVLVRVWATKAHDPKSLDYPLEVITKGIEFFNDYYGIPYPLPKCDNVAIPDFSSAAMENWGLITYREVVLLVDPATASHSNRETAAIVSLHELSHQWFGNLVTMKWWDDLWLNESFANVMEYVATDALYPEWKIWDSFASSEGLSALRRDALDGVQAVTTSVNHPDEISSLFDPSIVYAKGGRLLNMLMNYLGEGYFRKALTQYFTHHAYANTVGDDLWESLSNVSRQDIKAFMHPWLSQPGFPVVSVTQKDNRVAISQKHFSLNPAKSDESRLWPVPLLTDDTNVPRLLEEKNLEVNGSFRDYVRINHGAVGHYIVHYTEPEHRTAIAQLISTKSMSDVERLMTLSDASLLARGGVQPFAVTLKLLEEYMTEDSEPVWDVISIIIADLRRFIDWIPAGEAQVKYLIRKLIEAQYERLGWIEQPGEKVQDIKLRATILGLGVYSEHPDVVKHALELFDDFKRDNTAVPSELRGIILGAAVRNKVTAAFRYLLELEEKTDNVNLKQDLLGALTLTKDTSDIDVLLDRLKDSKKVRLHDVDHWLVYLMQSRFAQEQAWNWLRSNWQWIEKTFSGDKSYDYFPRYAASAFNTRKRLEEYITFFEPYKQHPALSRNILIGIEELSSRVDWLERDCQSVSKYLQRFKP